MVYDEWWPIIVTALLPAIASADKVKPSLIRFLFLFVQSF